MRTLTEDDIECGAALPPLRIDVTPISVVSAEPATTDAPSVHHEPRRARDDFLNILTTMGLVERYVTDWVGPEALIRSINVRLGVPAYAGDTLTFNGTVAAHEAGEVTVEVRGTVGMGDHATGTVRLHLPR
ncbi:acyl dehydratase [Sphaerisporangium album]|uniref:Acyl dehydratase n=2 Tax=Sphaerisporangium album TaxID=509200 RepID=A0A367FS50_9ACTN|nr:acyl dehydratase [Sphaerisporangium album]